MARPKEFIAEEALDAAIGVFREHGYEGTSAEMLVRRLGIGRQSLYDTFGDKWQLYVAAVQRYAARETEAHLSALASEQRALDGLRAMVERVVDDAAEACLGVNSICEFGTGKPELAAVRESSGRALTKAIVARIREAQAQGDVAAEIDPSNATEFLYASFAGIRVAARGGAGHRRLRSLGQLALRALA